MNLFAFKAFVSGKLTTYTSDVVCAIGELQCSLLANKFKNSTSILRPESLYPYSVLEMLMSVSFQAC